MIDGERHLHVSDSNLLAPFCCVHMKKLFENVFRTNTTESNFLKTLRNFLAWWSWQADLDFSYIKLKNFNWTVIPWHLRRQVGVITWQLLYVERLPANSENKRKDEIIFEWGTYIWTQSRTNFKSCSSKYRRQSYCSLYDKWFANFNWENWL